MKYVEKLKFHLKHVDKTLAKLDQIVNTAMNSEKLPWLLIAGLVVLNLISVLLFDGFSLFYNFDEYVVTLVGLQKFPLFFNTLLSEPHPPGFYLIIKFFSLVFPPPVLLKVALKLTSAILLSLSLSYFYINKKIFAKLQLEWGVVFILLSNSLLIIMSNLKQDLITVPIFFLIFFIALTEVVTQNFSLKREVSLVILATLLFFTGYLNYFFAFSWITACQLTNWPTLKKNWKPKLMLWLTHLLVLITYIGIFGFHQWQINQTRFDWVSHQSNSLINTFSLHISGLAPGETLADACFISISTFILYALYKRNALLSNKDAIFKKVFLLICALSCILIAVCYYAEFFSQTRYPFPLFLILSVLAGWGATLINKKIILLAILISLFGIKTAVYARSNVLLQSGFSAMIENIKTHAQVKKYGFVSSSTSGALYIKLQFFRDNPNIIAINPSYPRLYDVDTFGKDQLLYINVVLDQPDEKVHQIFQEYGLENIMYLNFNDQTFHDPKEQVVNVLTRSCELDSLEAITGTNLRIYYFSQCDFSKK